MAGGRGGGGCSQEHLGAKGEDAAAEGGGRTWRHPNRPYVHLWKRLLSSAKEGEDKDQREGR